MNWAASQVLLAPLTIQIRDGNYTMPSTVFSRLAASVPIIIQGNVANPERVKFTCASCGAAHFWTFSGTATVLHIQGVWLDAVAGTALYSGVDVAFPRYVGITSVIISNFATGLLADSGAVVEINTAVLSGCGYGIIAGNGALVISRTLNIRGSDAAPTYGVYSTGGSRISITDATISQVTYGVWCDTLASSAGAYSTTFGPGVGTQVQCPMFG